ncbi:MAG TPA: hypothetical protein VEH77_11690, partial [Roseiarcus sp.]|nr:hypothetical protein [Roseiarcus sp.]
MLETAPNARDILVSTLLDASVPHADLDRVLDQHEAAVRDDAHVFAAAFGAALKASNFDAGSKLIGQRWGVGNGFKVDFQDTGHYEALKWEVSGRNRS